MYVDGFLVAMNKNSLDAYKAMLPKMASYFKELGATQYVECVGDDVPYGKLTSFPRAVIATDDEVVIFAWVVYPSKEVRDAANKKMISDPAMEELMTGIEIDGKRMIFGGFNPIIGL
jgi:uncharacterized protein YbaA (DUF1428 family)